MKCGDIFNWGCMHADLRLPSAKTWPSMILNDTRKCMAFVSILRERYFRYEKSATSYLTRFITTCMQLQARKRIRNQLETNPPCNLSQASFTSRTNTTAPRLRDRFISIPINDPMKNENLPMHVNRALARQRLAYIYGRDGRGW